MVSLPVFSHARNKRTFTWSGRKAIRGRGPAYFAGVSLFRYKYEALFLAGRYCCKSDNFSSHNQLEMLLVFPAFLLKIGHISDYLLLQYQCFISVRDKDRNISSGPPLKHSLKRPINQTVKNDPAARVLS